MPPLHVANGDCTTRLIDRAGIPGARSIWADVLHEGPVPAGLTDEELLQVRARQLAGDGDPVEAVASALRRWRTAIDDIDTYDELVLWYEHDLFDQLNLIQLLGHIRTRAAAVRPVSLICIDSYPGHPRFRGLGELAPEDMGPLFDARQPVTGAAYEQAERAWLAFRAPDPGALEQVVAAGTAALPLLAPALRRHLEEFPWTTDGLSRSERRLLTLVAGGTARLPAAFPRMHDDEDAFYISDGAFWTLAGRLAVCAHPLIDIHVETRGPSALPDGTMALTDAGRSVLEGRQDQIALNGIDRWLGGVHLTPDRCYRWDAIGGRTRGW